LPRVGEVYHLDDRTYVVTSVERRATSRTVDGITKIVSNSNPRVFIFDSSLSEEEL